jgi:hypothetical protein
MSFSPVLPFGGYAGWTFLDGTLAKQKAALAANPATQRDETYFREKIGSVTSAEALVSDRRLLRVTLTAFGLEADIDAKAFIRKVLEEGTGKEGALANRLADKRYRELSSAFGFGDFATSRNQVSGFADKILTRFRDKSFEAAVGQQNNTFRLALNARSELTALASSGSSPLAKWYGILGSKPLREVFQGAFGLPPSFALVDIDRQLDVLRDRTASQLGVDDPADFSDPSVIEKLIRLYLVRAETAQSGTASPQSGALQLLSSGQQSLLSLLGR